MSEKKTPKIRFPEFTGDWEQRKFRELYKKSSEKNDGSIGIENNITVATMQFKEDVQVSTEEYLKTYYKFNVGDIAFEGHQSKEFRFGRFVENDIGDGIVSHIFAVFRPIVDYDLKFWKYAINNERLMQRVLSRSTKSSTMMHDLVTDDFLEQTFLVPNIKEQIKIGEFLSNLDNLIPLHQRKCEKIKEYKKGCLQKMFPKDGANVPEVRFPGFTGAWEQRKLKDITERIIVGLATSVTPYYRDKGVPLLRNMNIKENYLDDSDILYLDEDYANTNESKKIHTDDVLTVHTGANIGLTCLAPEKYDGCLSFTTLITTPQKDLLDSGFLMQYMNSNNGKNSIFSIITAGGKPNLNSGDLEKLEVLYPSLEEQKCISAFFLNLDNLITLHQRECDKYKELKKGLLQQMFV